MPLDSKPVRKPYYRGKSQDEYRQQLIRPVSSLRAVEEILHLTLLVREAKSVKSAGAPRATAILPAVRESSDLLSSWWRVAMTSAWESASFNRSGRSNSWLSTSANSYRTAAHLDDSCDIDEKYSLSGRGWYAIAAQERGNWTRSVNHSCDSNAEFVGTIIGKIHRWMLRSSRDIGMYEPTRS